MLFVVASIWFFLITPLIVYYKTAIGSSSVFGLITKCIVSWESLACCIAADLCTFAAVVKRSGKDY